MNLITETWRGLVRRKLWPVALLLIAALVAVPFTLAKDPEVEPVPANAVANAEEGLPATYVIAAGDEATEEDGTEKRRRTLGDTKDPFEPAPLPKAKKKKSTKKKATSSKQQDETSTSKDDSSSSGSTGGGTSAPSAPVATPTPTATPKPAPANSVRVRFARVAEDSTTEETEAATVQRDEVLPDETTPVLAYNGLENGGKVAVFELSGNVTVEGDGECEPTPEDCQYLKLRAGETAFITVADTGAETDAQYQLDLVKINAKAKASSSKLKKDDESALRTFEVLG